MINIDPKEGTILKFSVDVSGSEETPKPRLVIPISDKGISLVFEGTMKNGEVEVNISELIKLTDSKKFSGELEVVVDDSIFYPWKDSIVIKESTQVKASIKSTKKLNEDKVKVTAKKTSKESKESPVPIIKIKKNLGDLFSENL